MAQGWYDEIKDFNFDAMALKDETGHFTQLIWKSTRLIGCGLGISDDGYAYGVAKYNPIGNKIRTFSKNIARFIPRPYN